MGEFGVVYLVFLVQFDECHVGVGCECECLDGLFRWELECELFVYCDCWFVFVEDEVDFELGEDIWG